MGLPAEKVRYIANLGRKLQKVEFADEWIVHDKQASWGRLVVALRSLEMHKVASQIWKTYESTDADRTGRYGKYYKPYRIQYTLSWIC